MAVKGLDIFKLSPKKNCKECGSPTCMAFCMKVAQGAVPIENCPYMSDEAIALLSDATAPPMKTIEVGGHKLGGETVLFRHEKTFVSPTRYAVALASDDADADEVLEAIKAVDYERIGEREYVEYVFIEDKGGDVAGLVQKVIDAGRGAIVETTNTATAEAVLAVSTDVIITGADASNWEAMNAVVGGKAVLGLKGSPADLYDVADALEKADNKKLVFDVTADTVKKTFENAVLVRRSAIRDEVKVLGYPSIVNLTKLAPGDIHMQTALASLFTVKYGSIVVMEKMTYAEALALYGLRQNIFTDPQKPMKVEPGIYPLNGADENSPCMLTVDFALTYFLVSGEIERSKEPVNLLITDASGMSVLTAWAAGKFSSSTVQKFFEEYQVADKIKNRTLILPGKVAVMKGEIQAKLPEWNVVVGTREAVEIVKYLKDKEYVAAAEAAAKSKAPADSTGPAIITEGPIDYDKLVIPEIPHIDMGVTYKQRDPDSSSSRSASASTASRLSSMRL